MARASVKKKVKVKAVECKCLICDREAHPQRRGLCHYHYHQFDKAKRKLPKKKQADFDREQVAKGNILGSRQGRTPREPNPFAS